MKYDPDDSETGNFGAIRIDGTGSDVYGDAVKYGSDTFMCAVSAPNCSSGACPGTYPDACAETSPECDGPECDPQTGNLVGKTREGVEFRLDNTKEDCDTFEETFSGPDANGKYNLDPECNPFASGGMCPIPDTSPPAQCSRRVLLIPVIDEFGNGTSDSVTVQRFAMIYLMGLGECDSSGAGHCEVQGIFVKADITTNSLAGVFDEDASVHFTKLVE
jgi:hypothetical protein